MRKHIKYMLSDRALLMGNNENSLVQKKKMIITWKEFCKQWLQKI